VVLVPAVLGGFSLRAIGLRRGDVGIAWPAWAWLLGCLLLGVCVQLGLELHLPPAWLWAIPLVSVVALSGAVRRRQTAAGGVAEGPAIREPRDRGLVAFVLAGAAFCVFLAIAGMNRPCIEGDEGNIWSLKAKSLLVDWPDSFAATQVYNLHPDYPQLNPLLQAWTYAMTGVPDFVQFENRLLVQLCAVALFVAVAAALRRRLPALPAALLASLLLFEPEFLSLCRTAYADGMLALGLVVATDAFLRWRADGDRRYGWIAGFALAFALWSKNETMLYVGCAAAAAMITRAWVPPERGGWSTRNFVLLLPACAVVLNTAIWNRRFGMKSDLLGANPTGKSMFTLMAEQWQERVPAMFWEALHGMVSLSHAHVVFALAMCALLLAPRHALGRNLALPLLALLGAFAGIHVVYVGSFLPLRFHLDTSYTRVTFQLLPAMLVVIAAIVSEVVAERRIGHTAHRS
jgi:hypothetical protein